MAVAADGRFLYISETVSIYLGLSQVSARLVVMAATSMKSETTGAGQGVRKGKVITITRKRKRVKSNVGAPNANATCTVSRKARDSRKI